MKRLFTLLIYLNSLVLGLAVLIASPMLLVIFCNVVCIKYLKDKPRNKEHFKNYCWTLYVINCTERSDEGEGLITFVAYMAKNEEFLKEKYERALRNEF
jgi:hypothetical protein